MYLSAQLGINETRIEECISPYELNIRTVIFPSLPKRRPGLINRDLRGVSICSWIVELEPVEMQMI
jgi:hypothetical protein